MTVSQSLDAYLEPTRLSFGSPPASELLPHGPSSEESFPVFSPLPGVRSIFVHAGAQINDDDLNSSAHVSIAFNRIHCSRQLPQPPLPQLQQIRIIHCNLVGMFVSIVDSLV